MNDLVVVRCGDRWGVGAPGDVMVLTRSRQEAETLAQEAVAVLRQSGAQSRVRRPRGEARSFAPVDKA